MSDFSVVIITNGRCMPLLKFLIKQWLSSNANCIVGTTSTVIKQLENFEGINGYRSIETSITPEDHGSSIQTLLEVSDTNYTLLSADDILPVGNDFVQHIPRNPGATISAVRLLSVTGDRWYDWAVYKDGLSYLQPYEDRLPGTYITGGSQIISKEMIGLASYAELTFHINSDVEYCKRAEKAGAVLYPPHPNGPTLIHLDRFSAYNRPKTLTSTLDSRIDF